MKRIKIGGGSFEASQIALGCMRINALAPLEAEKLIRTAMDEGIDFFDHADIYGGGRSEEVFAQAARLSPGQRAKIWLQTKCGIRKGFFDFSCDHILESVDRSLQRLQAEYIDVLLLHRPDALVEPEEVARAFDQLQSSGKVRHFGVSNQNPMQIELLKRYVRQPLIINQLQLSLTNTGMIDAGLNVNMEIDPSINRDGSILDYCRLHDMTIQPWSPLQYGFFEGVFLNNDKFPELNKTIGELGEHYKVPDIAIAIAWLMRHPAGMQPIIGTTNLKRVQDICQAAKVDMTRQEWYALYLSAGNKLP